MSQRTNKLTQLAAVYIIILSLSNYIRKPTSYFTWYFSITS